jgi:hypothetical protein
MDARGEQPATEEPSPDLQAVLLEVARNLRSPPLLFGFGVIIALVLVAVTTVSALDAVEVPILLVAAAALVSWLGIEVLRVRTRLRRDVSVRARQVGRRGVVGGVEGLPGRRRVPKVDVRAEDVEGRVTGVTFEPKSEDHRGASE